LARANGAHCICTLGVGVRLSSIASASSVFARVAKFVNAAALEAMLTRSNDSRQHDFADLDQDFFSLSDRDVRLHRLNGGQLNEHNLGQIG